MLWACWAGRREEERREEKKRAREEAEDPKHDASNRPPRSLSSSHGTDFVHSLVQRGVMVSDGGRDVVGDRGRGREQRRDETEGRQRRWKTQVQKRARKDAITA